MIKPALTAEEWAERLVGEYPYVMVDLKQRDVSNHGIAAKLLYGQPFGFTREDVKVLRHATEEGGDPAMDLLADRIEALLPPKEDPADA